MLRLQCDRKLNLDSIITLASNNVIFENTAYKTSSSGLLFINYRNSKVYILVIYGKPNGHIMENLFIASVFWSFFQERLLLQNGCTL